MSYKISIDSVDLDWQIEMLKLYPAIAERHYRNAMSESVKLLYATIRAGVPFALALQSLQWKITGQGLNIQGAAGWFTTDFWQINIFEYGIQKPYEITAKSNHPFLKFLRSGDAHFVPAVEHPAMPGMHFVQNAWDATQPQIEEIFDQASMRVMAELSAPSGGGTE